VLKYFCLNFFKKNQFKQQYEDEIERITNDRGKLRKELDQAKEKIDELIKEKNTLVINFESEKDELANEIDRLKNDDLVDRVDSLREDNNKLIMDLVKNKKEFHIKLQQDRELIDSLKAELDSLKY
jgi:chromosome segregation ATPase